MNQTKSRKAYDWGVCEFDCYVCGKEIPEGAGVDIGQGKHRHKWCMPDIKHLLKRGDCVTTL